jgi:3-deoxy-manno-octulosonate cytidylyltransferase (CMP-KDO synthetase)
LIVFFPCLFSGYEFEIKANTMNTLIVIPARYASSRLPGKPLKKIDGQTMLSRVVNIARSVSQVEKNVDFVVATDDQRIMDHCNDINAPSVMTSDQCRTGSDRVLEAVKNLGRQPDFILNLQGDAPLTPPEFLSAMIRVKRDHPDLPVVTPVVQLTWDELDKLRQSKKETPFSGTTVILNTHGKAVWFSKRILPVIRNEDKRRSESDLSPVHRHIGLYGFDLATLERFVDLPTGHYEQFEQLEQLRLLENGTEIGCVKVSYDDRPQMSGVDTAKDLQRVQELLERANA